MTFSERLGLKPVRVAMQLDSVDDELRNGLWNCLTMVFWEKVDWNLFLYDKRIQGLLRDLWLNHFKKPLENIPDRWREALGILRKYFFGFEWYEVYDFIEFVAKSESLSSIRKCNA